MYGYPKWRSERRDVKYISHKDCYIHIYVKIAVLMLGYELKVEMSTHRKYCALGHLHQPINRCPPPALLMLISNDVARTNLKVKFSTDL